MQKGEGYQQLLATSAPSGSYTTEQSYWDCVKQNCGNADGGRNPDYFDCSAKCYYNLYTNSGGDNGGACQRTCEGMVGDDKEACLQTCYSWHPMECQMLFGDDAFPQVP